MGFWVMVLLWVPSRLGFKLGEGECRDLLVLKLCCLAGKFCFPGDIWQYLQIYSVTTLGLVLSPLALIPGSQWAWLQLPGPHYPRPCLCYPFSTSSHSWPPYMPLVILLLCQDPVNPMTWTKPCCCFNSWSWWLPGIISCLLINMCMVSIIS